MAGELPILLISFNRPEMTEGALLSIRELKPKKLFFTSDAPRVNNGTDADFIEECKNLLRLVDWECEIITRYAEINHGPGVWPHKAISWAFEHVDELLVVEHDVRISLEFYKEAQRLGNIYREHEDVFAICGLNISRGINKKYSNNYFYTQYFSGWGWMTWKDRWSLYEPVLELDNQIKFIDLLKINNYNIFITYYFHSRFNKVRKKELKTWDFQIANLIFREKLNVIKFSRNMSVNVGGGKDATHTKYMPLHNIQNAPNTKNMNSFNPNSKYFEKKWRAGMIWFLFKSILLRLRRA